MPVTRKLIRGKWRIVEESTGYIAVNRAGTPVDGGGHRQVAKAQRQADAINRSIAERKKK